MLILSLCLFASLKTDFLIFSAISLAVFLLLHLLWWRRCFCLMHVLAWGGLILVLPLSWALTERGESRERRYLAEPLEGFAPTYALEMGRMGHVKIGLDTEADDPQYLKLIDAQVEWLKANSRAASLYTFRKVPGRDYLHVEGEPIQFIVACETDYDRNGTIEGEREQRVPIGEQFDDTDVAMLTVFLGNPTFSEEPVVDRWGDVDERLCAGVRTGRQGGGRDRGGF